jgi:ribosomal-protein-alanine N-acetyltransferase
MREAALASVTEPSNPNVTNVGTVQVVPAMLAERDWCAELMFQSEPWTTLGRSLTRCRRICHSPESLVHLAQVGNLNAGFVILNPRGLAGAPYLASVAVAPEWRSRGIGTKLMEYAEDCFRGGSAYLYLCVSDFNTRARAMYERRGYQAIGELGEHIREGSAEVLMRKRLEPRAGASVTIVRTDGYRGVTI